MCELFAMSSRVPTRVRFLLDALARRGGAEDHHRDGWGVAFCEDGDALVLREPAAASESALVRFMESSGPRSRLVLSHIRKGTVGPTRLANTHPFARPLGGRLHLFAHNGDVPGVRHDRRFDPGRHHPIGDGDSELAFGALLHRLEPLWAGAEVPALAERLAVVARFAAELAELGPANFLYADGDVLFAHGDRRRQRDGRIAAPGLHVVERRCHEEFGERETEGVVVSPSALAADDPAQRVVMLASVPLTGHESWTPLAQGEILVLRSGEVLTRSRRCSDLVPAVPSTYRSSRKSKY
jgi:glutamine amidotransferase